MGWSTAVTIASASVIVLTLVVGFLWLLKYAVAQIDQANTNRGQAIEQERLRQIAEKDRDDQKARADKAEAECNTAKKTVAILQATLGQKYQDSADKLKQEIDKNADEDPNAIANRVFGMPVGT